jgi:hypothetical protein
MRRQDLDRDLAPQLAVVRAVHFAHAANAKGRQDPVRPELTMHHRGAAGRRNFGDRDLRRGRFEERLRIVAEQ